MQGEGSDKIWLMYMLIRVYTGHTVILLALSSTGSYKGKKKGKNIDKHYKVKEKNWCVEGNPTLPKLSGET